MLKIISYLLLRVVALDRSQIGSLLLPSVIRGSGLQKSNQDFWKWKLINLNNFVFEPMHEKTNNVGSDQV